MAIVKPFSCLRPAKEYCGRVAALPYDVYTRAEARKQIEREPMSFLKIDRQEAVFPEEVDIYDPRTYENAAELLREMEEQGIYERDADQAYYIYELTQNGRSQAGLAACCAVDDYMSRVVKKHENTRTEKEADRVRHIEVVGAHTGPIFMAYRDEGEIASILREQMERECLYAFTSPDGVGHRLWKIGDPELCGRIEKIFRNIPALYIADGHHRAAAAVRVALKRREQGAGPEDPSNYFLSILFPESQLEIRAYNRLVKDIRGMTPEQFLARVERDFLVERTRERKIVPESRRVFGMFFDGAWYRLTPRPEILTDDPVEGLDVSLLQNHLLGPVLGIEDPRTDKRVEFVGGDKDAGDLERRALKDMRLAFSLYPTGLEELFRVADAGRLMPPKSTWFEPKPRSGILIHRI